MRRLVYDITNLLQDLSKAIYRKVSLCEDVTFEYRIYRILLKCKQNLLKDIELNDLKKEQIRIRELMLNKINNAKD